MKRNTTQMFEMFFRERGHHISAYIKKLFLSMSLFEKALVILFIAGLLFGVGRMSKEVYVSLTTEVPARGGEVTEGLVGTPRFINPLLATSEVDRSLSEIIYAALYTYDSKGNLTPELAESAQISEDGRVYTVTLKENITFHDGEPLTADDVVFTIEAAQNPFVRSPSRANWSGVQVTALSDRTVEFELPAPFTPFPHNLTLGILPKHIWEETPLEQMPFSEFNLEPIGAGPYTVASVKSGNTSTRYVLRPFSNYVLDGPFISRLEIHTFADEEELWDAFRRGSIDGSADLDASRFEDPEDTDQLITRRVFAVFIKQSSHEFFRDELVRRALDSAIDRELIIKEALGGFGKVVEGPMPFLGGGSLTETQDPSTLFSEAGWQINEESGTIEGQDGEILSFTLHTSTANELQTTARMLKDEWGEYGVSIDVKMEDVSTLLENTIRPRLYDALLFGYVVGYDNDLYGFWHSSGRNDPGLNTALYTNLRVDQLLEEARQTGEKDELEVIFNEFNEVITSDTPALFLYSPTIPYIQRKNIEGERMEEVVNASDRFITIHTWYLDTKRAWNTFIN